MISFMIIKLSHLAPEVRSNFLRFSGHPSVPLSVHPCVRDSRGSFMFPRYLQYLLTDFRQTFVIDASRDRDELIRFWVQKFKVTPSSLSNSMSGIVML